jgi:hypothetical protein
MTFKASNQTAADAYASIKRQAAATKTYMTQQATAMQSPTSQAWVPLGVIQHLRDVIALMDGFAATPGLAAYAQAQENDGTYDVVAEYQAMRAAMVSARNTLIGMFPTSGGFLAYQTMDASGNLGVRTFTAAQLAPVVTQCQSVAATIS